MHTRFFAKARLRLFTFLALATIATSAFSQSAEYRRGYDQGFRDGQAAHERSGRQEPAHIVILAARYGTRDSACDARETIRSFVGWRRHVDVLVNNDLCGDPARGRPKHLFVEYRCGGEGAQRSEAREGETMSLYCR